MVYWILKRIYKLWGKYLKKTKDLFSLYISIIYISKSITIIGQNFCLKVLIEFGSINICLSKCIFLLKRILYAFFMELGDGDMARLGSESRYIFKGKFRKKIICPCLYALMLVSPLSTVSAMASWMKVNCSRVWTMKFRWFLNNKVNYNLTYRSNNQS